MPWGALAAAGISYLGQRSANRTNARFASDASRMSQANAREAMRFTDAQAMRQMKFQERMSNTAHQRAVADLRQAGLNPILAARQPASSPAGAGGQGFMGQRFTYQHQNVAKAAIEGYQTATQAQLNQATAKNIGVQTQISQRTLNYLRQNNLSMPQVQYTVKNVLGSNILNTFEKALSGKVNELTGVYKALGAFIQQRAQNAGMFKGGKGASSMSISGWNLGKLIADIATEAKRLGLSVVDSVVDEIKDLIK